jgi:4-hydroxybutyrate dehydrogenase
VSKMSYSFYFPTKLVVSEDAGTDLVCELEGAPAKGVFVLTDRGLVEAGLAARLLDKLSTAGFEPAVYDGVPGNPNVPDVLKALETVRGKLISHVVAIGGGSVIDVAKAVGLLLADDELNYEEVQWRRQTIRKGSLPVIGVPTTAGTGSEATKVAVIGDSQGFKMGVLNPALFLKSAIIDGGLMLSLPAHLTAATGMDALVHAIEAFLSKRATPASDIFALEALRRIVRWLPEAFKDGSNLQARREMGVAAAWAGIAFDQSSLALVHALAGPLCGAYHLHHGAGVAVLLPAVLDFNAPAIPPERWTALREAISLPDNAKPEALGDWSRGLLTTLGMPTHLSEIGLEPEGIEAIAESATRMAMIGANPRQAGLEECKQILEAAL